MRQFLIRRILQSLPIIAGVLVLTFFFANLMPGDPLAMYVNPEFSPELRAQMAVRFGLNDPLPTRFFKWSKNFLCGDFGISYTHNRPVRDIILEAIPHTLLLSSISLVVAVVTGVFLGTISALKRYSGLDYVITILSLFIYAMPTFWLAIMLVTVFSLKLGWLPPSNVMSIDAENLNLLAYLWDRLKHLIMPVIIMGVGTAAAKARYMRSSLLEVVRQDYIRTARAKGLPEYLVIGKHALRNALIPIITLIGISVPALLEGSLVVEVIFAWPGMGQLVVNSIFNRDYPLVMAVTFISAVMVILGNLLADLAYSWVDPRIHFE